MSLSGLEIGAIFGEILERQLGGNAKSNAITAELLSVVEAWPSLSAAMRGMILKLLATDRPTLGKADSYSD
jgi:hypothetical protein